jgi:nucleoid DNA-binding protein
VAERSGLTRYKDKRNVERLVRAFLEELREAIVAGEDVSLYGLARIVRGDIAGLENTLVQFHPGERLRAALKGKKPRWKRSKRA